MDATSQNWLVALIISELSECALWLESKDIKEAGSSLSGDDVRYTQVGYILKVFRITGKSRWVQVATFPHPKKPQCHLADATTSLSVKFRPQAMKALDTKDAKRPGSFVNIIDFDIVCNLSSDGDKQIELSINDCEPGATTQAVSKQLLGIKDQPDIIKLLRQLQTKVSSISNNAPRSSPDIQEIEASAFTPSQRTSLSAAPTSGGPGAARDKTSQSGRTLYTDVAMPQGVNMQPPIRLHNRNFLEGRYMTLDGHSPSTGAAGLPANADVPTGLSLSPTSMRRASAEARSLFQILQQPQQHTHWPANIDPSRMFDQGLNTLSEGSVNAPPEVNPIPRPAQFTVADSVQDSSMHLMTQLPGVLQQSVVRSPSGSTHAPLTAAANGVGAVIDRQTFSNKDSRPTNAQVHGDALMTQQSSPTDAIPMPTTQESDVLSQGPALPTEQPNSNLRQTEHDNDDEIEDPVDAREDQNRGKDVSPDDPAGRVTAAPEDPQLPLNLHIAQAIITKNGHRTPHNMYWKAGRSRIPEKDYALLNESHTWRDSTSIHPIVVPQGLLNVPEPELDTAPGANEAIENDKDKNDDNDNDDSADESSSESENELPTLPLERGHMNGTQESSPLEGWDPSSPIIEERSNKPVERDLPPDSSDEVQLRVLASGSAVDMAGNDDDNDSDDELSEAGPAQALSDNGLYSSSDLEEAPDEPTAVVNTTRPEDSPEDMTSSSGEHRRAIPQIYGDGYPITTPENADNADSAVVGSSDHSADFSDDSDGFPVLGLPANSASQTTLVKDIPRVRDSRLSSSSGRTSSKAALQKSPTSGRTDSSRNSDFSGFAASQSKYGMFKSSPFARAIPPPIVISCTSAIPSQPINPTASSSSVIEAAASTRPATSQPRVEIAATPPRSSAAEVNTRKRELGPQAGEDKLKKKRRKSRFNWSSGESHTGEEHPQVKASKERREWRNSRRSETVVGAAEERSVDLPAGTKLNEQVDQLAKEQLENRMTVPSQATVIDLTQTDSPDESVDKVNITKPAKFSVRNPSESIPKTAPQDVVMVEALMTAAYSPIIPETSGSRETPKSFTSISLRNMEIVRNTPTKPRSVTITNRASATFSPTPGQASPSIAKQPVVGQSAKKAPTTTLLNAASNGPSRAREITKPSIMTSPIVVDAARGAASQPRAAPLQGVVTAFSKRPEQVLREVAQNSNSSQQVRPNQHATATPNYPNKANISTRPTISGNASQWKAKKDAQRLAAETQITKDGTEDLYTSSPSRPVSNTISANIHPPGSAAARTLGTLSAQRIEHLRELKEPRRTFNWLQEVCEYHESSYLPQVEIWKAYQHAFNLGKNADTLVGKDFLQLISAIFPTAALESIQTGPKNEAMKIVRGIRAKALSPRNSPMSHSGTAPDRGGHSGIQSPIYVREGTTISAKDSHGVNGIANRGAAHTLHTPQQITSTQSTRAPRPAQASQNVARAHDARVTPRDTPTGPRAPPTGPRSSLGSSGAPNPPQWAPRGQDTNRRATWAPTDGLTLAMSQNAPRGAPSGPSSSSDPLLMTAPRGNTQPSSRNSDTRPAAGNPRNIASTNNDSTRAARPWMSSSARAPLAAATSTPRGPQAANRPAAARAPAPGSANSRKICQDDEALRLRMRQRILDTRNNPSDTQWTEDQTKEFFEAYAASTNVHENAWASETLRGDRSLSCRDGGSDGRTRSVDVLAWSLR